MRHRVMLLDRRSLPRPGTRDTACLWSMRRPRRLRWLVSCRTGLGGNQLDRLVGQRTASLNDISEDSIRRGRVQMSAFRLGTVEGRSLAGHTLHVTDLLSQIRIIRFMRNAKRYAERPCLRSSTQLGNELLYDAQRFPYRALTPTQSREIPMGAYQTGAA